MSECEKCTGIQSKQQLMLNRHDVMIKALSERERGDTLKELDVDRRVATLESMNIGGRLLAGKNRIDELEFRIEKLEYYTFCISIAVILSCLFFIVSIFKGGQ